MRKGKKSALVTAEINRDALSNLKASVDFRFEGYGATHKMLAPAELRELVADTEILITEFDTIDSKVFDQASNLEIIICCRGGVSTVVDVNEASRRGVLVCNNIGRNAEAVSDFTLGFIIDLTRNISKTNRMIHDKRLIVSTDAMPSEYQDSLWGLTEESPYVKFRGRSLRGMVLGLVGFGHAGRLVAQKAQLFGMNILFYDPNVSQSDATNAQKVEFEYLLKNSDIVSLHCPGGSALDNLMSADQFSAMKDGAFFINVARGNLVDEQALRDALESGKLKGAAIDLLKHEPMRPDDPFIGVENLIVTPHIAGSSEDTLTDGTAMAVESLEDYLAGKKPLHCLNFEELRR